MSSSRYIAQLRDVASSLTSGICSQSDHPAGCAAAVEQYLNAWQVYSYVCPRAACVLREMQLQPARTRVGGFDVFAERDSDYRVQGIKLFSQALASSEPHLLLAFGELVRQVLSGAQPALDHVPVLKSVVSSYIHQHDCAPLFSEFMPQEALRSATSSMQVQPVDDETLKYSCPGGLEETILKVSPHSSSAVGRSGFLTLSCRQSEPGSSSRSAARVVCILLTTQCWR